MLNFSCVALIHCNSPASSGQIFLVRYKPEYFLGILKVMTLSCNKGKQLPSTSSPVASPKLLFLFDLETFEPCETRWAWWVTSYKLGAEITLHTFLGVSYITSYKTIYIFSAIYKGDKLNNSIYNQGAHGLPGRSLYLEAKWPGCFDWILDLVLEGLNLKRGDIHRFQVLDGAKQFK